MDAAKRLAYLFYRYYEKSCTQQEKDELFALLLYAAHDKVLKGLIEKTLADHVPAYLQDGETANKILEQVVSRQTPLNPAAGPFRNREASRSFVLLDIHRLRPAFVLRGAAILLLVVSASFLAYFYSRHHARTAPPLAVSSAEPANDPCITLPDGSKVLLHKDARIRYDPPFTGKTREVYLSGEAYFDIRSDERPFIVHTGNIKTIVLGTAFNINAHDRDFTITVTRGKVRVENGEGDYSILRRNEQAIVDRIHHNKLKKIQVDAGEAIAWKKTYLLFNDVSMKEAAQELEERFHVKFVFMNPATETCRVTATFTGGEPLEKIITVLSKINNMDYKIVNGAMNGVKTGTTIEWSGEGCK